MSDYNHLESLKDKEFAILEKLSRDISGDEKIKLEKELEQVRGEIEKLR